MFLKKDKGAKLGHLHLGNIKKNVEIYHKSTFYYTLSWLVMY